MPNKKENKENKKNKPSPKLEPDGYYDESDLGEDELDISFLDDD